MDIKLELISSAISETIIERLGPICIDADQIAYTSAIKIISEIQKVIQNNSISDFEAIEQIVVIFEKYGVSAGIRHDFG